MGATELVQGLGRALAVLRDSGAGQESVQRLEDDITALDAVSQQDAVEGERRAAALVARLYGIDPAAAAAWDPLAEPAAAAAAAPAAAESVPAAPAADPVPESVPAAAPAPAAEPAAPVPVPAEAVPAPAEAAAPVPDAPEATPKEQAAALAAWRAGNPPAV